MLKHVKEIGLLVVIPLLLMTMTLSIIGTPHVTKMFNLTTRASNVTQENAIFAQTLCTDDSCDETLIALNPSNHI